MNEIDFPDLPDKIQLSEYESDDTYQESKQNADFQNTSKFPLQIKVDAQQVTDADLDSLDLSSLDKKVLINELSDYDMYLKNIHKGFGFIGSTNSLIKLVMAGVGVHKRRREVLKELKGNPKRQTLELDENGELS